MTRFEAVRIHLLYRDGGCDHLPLPGKPRMDRWFAEWFVRGEIALGSYKGRRVDLASILSLN